MEASSAHIPHPIIEVLLLEEIIYLPLSLLRKSHREPLSRGQRDFYLQCIFLSGKEVQGYLCYPDWQVATVQAAFCWLVKRANALLIFSFLLKQEMRVFDSLGHVFLE